MSCYMPLSLLPFPPSAFLPSLLSQTVFGEMIPVSPTEALSKALGTFLLERLLSNQQITEAYARPNTTGGFQEGARERWEGGRVETTGRWEGEMGRWERRRVGGMVK